MDNTHNTHSKSTCGWLAAKRMWTPKEHLEFKDCQRTTKRNQKSISFIYPLWHWYSFVEKSASEGGWFVSEYTPNFFFWRSRWPISWFALLSPVFARFVLVFLIFCIFFCHFLGRLLEITETSKEFENLHAQKKMWNLCQIGKEQINTMMAGSPWIPTRPASSKTSVWSQTQNSNENAA